MVTFLDFFHFRSARGLARRCRRYARRLGNMIDHAEDFMKKASVHTEAGEAKATYNCWVEIYNCYEQEELLIEKITHNEYDILQTDVSKEENLRKEVDDDLKMLPDPQKQRLEALDRKFEEIKTKVSAWLTEIRVQEKDIMLDRNRISIRWSKDKVYAWDAKLHARDEGRRTRWAKDDEKHLEHLAKELASCVKAKKPSQDMDKIIAEMESLMSHFEEEFLKEMEDISRVMKDIFNIHLRMVHHIENEVPGELQKLMNEGLDPKYSQDLMDKHKKIVQLIRAHNERLKDLSRYLERHHGVGARI